MTVAASAVETEFRENRQRCQMVARLLDEVKLNGTRPEF